MFLLRTSTAIKPDVGDSRSIVLIGNNSFARAAHIIRRRSASTSILADLLHRNWPQQLRLEEPAPKDCQDDRRETDHGGIDQQARTADHLGLEKAIAEEKQDMSEAPAANATPTTLPLYGPRIAQA